jgi:hypothetical protein
MHSRSADCVLGEARLISSPTTMLAKTPPGSELELAGVLVEHRDAGDVGRQQVGRELDAAHRAVDAAGERLAEHGLADARDVLDEEVTLGQEDDEGGVDHVGLALDHLLDVAAHGADHAGQGLEVGRSGARCVHVCEVLP